MKLKIGTIAGFAIALLVCMGGRGSEAFAASPEGFLVVVNSQNATAGLNREETSRLFLKKKTSWGDGTPVQPVDLRAGDEVRENFSRNVHKRSANAIKNYWTQAMFGGRDTPPVMFPSAEEVLAFVRENSGAIGYVPQGTVLSGNFRVVYQSP